MSEDRGDSHSTQSTPPSGYWQVAPRPGEDGTPDIHFKLLLPDPPLDQRELKNAVEKTLTIIKKLYGKPEDKSKLSETCAKLLSLSQVGLVGKNASPLVGLDALRALEADIVERESGPIKN
jgi:hypothetical protein